MDGGVHCAAGHMHCRVRPHEQPNMAQKTLKERLLGGGRGATVSTLMGQMLGQDRAARLALLLKRTQESSRHALRGGGTGTTARRAPTASSARAVAGRGPRRLQSKDRCGGYACVCVCARACVCARVCAHT